MIYTSYFGNWRKYPPELKKICIARYAPPGFKADGKDFRLAPTEDLLRRIKTGIIDHNQYTLEFNEQLTHLNPYEIAEQYQNCILLCYEKSTDFCHRHLVREWLQKHNIECQELSNLTA